MDMQVKQEHNDIQLRGHEPLSVVESAPSSSSPYFTSMRRTTRSLAAASYSKPLIPSSSTIVNSNEPQSQIPSSSASPMTTSKLDIAKYAYQSSTSTPPRKKRKTTNSGAVDHGSLSPTLVKIEEVLMKEDPSQSPIKTPNGSKYKKPIPQLALAKPHPPPPKWEEQYRLIEHMRQSIVAPVDNMGCERPRTVVDDDPKTLRFHILISLMLSSQTKDPVTSAAVTTLHDTLPGGLTASSLASAPIEEIQHCINKVGFWRRKSDYIKDAAIYLLEHEDGDVPKTLNGLCKLKGVGPKMAFLALQCAWDINAGIGVDVHVHRITNRLKWHKPPTTTPEATRLNLQSWLPPHLHKPINPLLVGFGQMICLPVGPRCDLCLLGQKKICPSRITNVNTQGRKDVASNFGDVGPKIEIGYEDETENVIPKVDEEAGLVKIKDEPSPPPSSSLVSGIRMGMDNEDKCRGGGGVKMERDLELDTIVQEPGLKKVDQVLEIIDRVDGARDVDGLPLSL